MNEVIVWFVEALLSMLGETEAKTLDIIQCDPSKPTSGSFSNPFYNFGTTITDHLTNIAVSICALLFCIEFIKKLMKMGKFEMEDIMVVAYKFVLAKAALDIGNQLMTAMFATGSKVLTGSIMTKLENSNGEVIDLSSSAYNTAIVKLLSNTKTAVENLGFLQTIGVLATLLIPLIAIKIISMVGYAMAYGRLFELTMYHIIYPIPCSALLFDQGRVTKRFLTSYFACVLQGAFMIISICIFNFISVNCLTELTKAMETAGDGFFMENLGKVAFELLMASLIMVIGMTKSSSWARRMLGEE